MRGMTFEETEDSQVKSLLGEAHHYARYIGAVFVAAIVVTLLFWAILPSSLRLDEGSDYKSAYEPIARNLLAGRGYLLADGTPGLGIAPGYPLLLAALFGASHLTGIPEELVHSAFVLLCVGVASVLIFLIATSVWGPVPALVAALAWMTYPFALWLTKQPSSEIPFVVPFLAGFYLFWQALLRKSESWAIYFCSGLLIGFSMLIRPIAIGLGLLLALILWWAGKWLAARARLYLVAMLLLGNLIAILPWETWVYAQTGHVAAISGHGTAGIRDGLTFAVDTKGYREQVAVPQDVVALQNDLFDLSRQGKLDSTGAIVSELLAQMKTRPLAVAELFIIKAARSWYGTDSGRSELPSLLLQIAYMALIIWGSVVAWKRGGNARQITLLVWLVTLYFWAMTISVLSILRYMVPIMSLLFVLVPALLVRFGRNSNKAPALETD